MLQRLQAPTPKFFAVLRRVGLVLAGVGAAIVASPVALPAAVAVVGGYLITAGAVAAAVSQLTTRSETLSLRPFLLPIRAIYSPFYFSDMASLTAYQLQFRRRMKRAIKLRATARPQSPRYAQRLMDAIVAATMPPKSSTS